MGIFYEAQLTQKFDFLKSFSFFKNLEINNLLQILKNMKMFLRRKGEVIYNEGDAVQSIFFVKEGEV